MEQFLRVGVISTVHGVHGEVKVFPTTDDPRRFLDLKEVLLDTGRGHLTLEIKNVKFFKKFVIIKFKDYDKIEDIEKYKGKDLLVSREHAVALEEDEYFICDVIGAKVITDTEDELGILKDVLQTGANDVYIVETKAGKEVLLPVIKECVLSIDVENKVVLVHIMPGLLD